LFALIHLCVFCPTIAAHPTCVFSSLVDDMHINSPTSDVLPFFFIIRGVWRIMTFNAIDQVCCFVSTNVRPIYITSSRFSYT